MMNYSSNETLKLFENYQNTIIADLSSIIIIDDLHELIGQLNRFTQKHQIVPLKNETKKLEQAVESFDVEQIRFQVKAIRKIFDCKIQYFVGKSYI